MKEEYGMEQMSNKVLYIILVVFVALVVGGYWGYQYFAPLSDEKELIKSQNECHNQLKKMRMLYGSNIKCDKCCHICHPLTWRREIRKLRNN